MIKHKKLLASLIVIFIFALTEYSYALEEFPGSGDRVIYSRSEQQVWLIDADENIRGSWFVTGHRKYPVNGDYRVYSRSISSRSIDSKVTFTHMVRFTKGPNGTAIGFHSIPLKTGTKIPIMPPDKIGNAEFSSPGCIRQLKSDAMMMWDWAQIGTKVIVVD